MNTWTKREVKHWLSIGYAILILSGLYVLATSGWLLTANQFFISLMEILTILSAIMILVLFIAIYLKTSEEKRGWGIIAVIFASSMSAITIMNHFLYLTVVRQLDLSGYTVPAVFRLGTWPSVINGLEYVSWGFFLGLALLCVSVVFTGNKKLLISIKWTLRISGSLCLIGLAGPITGIMSLYFFSTAGYSLGFLALSIQLIVFLKKQI